MRAQTIYNKVVKHLRKQNAQSLFKGQCRYHSPDGMKCAVGCLILDKEYDSLIEGHIVDTLIHSKFASQSLIDMLVEHQALLSCLQNVHDNHYPMYWEIELRIVATQFNLKYTPPEV